MKSITHLPSNSTNPFLDYNLLTFYPNPQNTDTLTIKGDQRFSDKDSLSGRFTRSRLHSEQDGGRYGSPIPTLTNGYGTGRADSWIYSTSVTYNRTFTPTLLNELLLAANRNPNGQGTLADNTPWANQSGTSEPLRHDRLAHPLRRQRSLGLGLR